MNAKIIVAGWSGVMEGHPEGGGWTWCALNHLLGLRQLGYVPFYLTQEGSPDPAFVETVVRGVHTIMERYGLGDQYGVVVGDRSYGLSLEALERVAREAVLLINLEGHCSIPVMMAAARRRAYVDQDPGFTQFWAASGIDMNLAAHDVYFTTGESIGKPGCPVPTLGYTWHATRHPVALEAWPLCPPPRAWRITTMAGWRGYAAEYQGEEYLGKYVEFERIMDLPRHWPTPLEVAMEIDPSETEDLTRLHANGWRLVDPTKVLRGPWGFQAYIQGSSAELSVSKHGYVAARCGWFSDKSVYYLATGRPVILQDTGYRAHLPTGEGLLPWRTGTEALAALEAVTHNYTRHSQAARRLAETHFDARAVLHRMLADAGVA